jgi:hypothetical protein
MSYVLENTDYLTGGESSQIKVEDILDNYLLFSTRKLKAVRGSEKVLLLRIN